MQGADTHVYVLHIISVVVSFLCLHMCVCV